MIYSCGTDLFFFCCFPLHSPPMLFYSKSCMFHYLCFCFIQVTPCFNSVNEEKLPNRGYVCKLAKYYIFIYFLENNTVSFSLMQCNLQQLFLLISF